jgi:hypothetical protein
LAHPEAEKQSEDNAVKQAAAMARDEVQKSAKAITSKAKTAARENVKQVAETVQEEASGFSSVVMQATQAGAREFQEAGYPTVASYTRRLGDSAADFAGTIDGFDVDGAVRRASSSVSRNPALAIGAMAALGFLGAVAVASINKQSH